MDVFAYPLHHVKHSFQYSLSLSFLLKESTLGLWTVR